MRLNGTALPVTWTSVNSWTSEASLQCGTSTLTVAGLNNRAEPVGEAGTTTVTVTCAAPPELSSVVVSSDGRVSFVCRVTPGFLLRVEYKDDLSALDWTPLGEDQVVASASIPVSDLPGRTQRFYRARLLEP